MNLWIGQLQMVMVVVMMVLSALLFRSEVSKGIAQHFRSHRAGGWSAKVQHPVGAAQARAGSGEAPDSEADSESEGLHKGSRQILRK